MMFRFTLLLAVVALAISCDKVPLTAPTGSTITISIDRTVLPLNGQAKVSAIVTEAGGTPPHDGTTVTFSSTIGNMVPVEAQTINGVATSILNAGSVSGKGTIKAFSGGAVTATGAEITIGAAAATTIAVSATPSSVSQSGGTVTVAALVLDASGNPLPGVNVNFSADAGQLSAPTALSDANGVARVQLQTAQTAKVTATAGTATKDVTVTVSSAPSATIAVTPPSPFVGVPAAITVTPATGGTRQVQSVTVDYGDGTSDTAVNPTGPVGFTHTWHRAGGFTVTARSTDVAGNTGIASTAIIVQSSNPTISVGASPSSGPAPLTSTISGTASPTAGGPAIANVRVLVNGEQVYTTSSGGNYSFAYRFTSPATTYTVSAIATDAAGNESRATTIVLTN